MDENRRNADKSHPDFDLTTPNIQLPNNRPAAPSASDSDRTTLNIPPPRPENKPRRAAPPQNRFDLTSVNIGASLLDDEEEARTPVRPVAPTAQTLASPAAAKRTALQAASRRPPMWIWFAVGGVALILIVGLAAFFLFGTSDAFTLRVLNAPPGSRVYVDDVPSGVPQRDGTILVQGLRAGVPRDVRVVQSGFADWRTSVTGEGGTVQDLTANLTPLESAPALPAEIDYNGKMVLIPAGSFMMGNNGYNADEAPPHEVTLPAYYIDKYEVTNEQYRKFCDAASHAPPVNPFWDATYFESNPQMPVVGISYTDAAAYAEWAGKRLPTEEEWEKAASWGASATAKRLFPWGDAPEKGRANIGTEHPTVVGAYTEGASAYGVQDMTGNVREWVDSFYTAYPGATASNPKFDGSYRVARGGDFRASLDFARTTSRLAVKPDFKTAPEDAAAGRSSLIGFRCAVSADAPKIKAHLQQAKSSTP